MVKQRAKTVTPRLRFPAFVGRDDWSTERMDRLYLFGRNNILSRDKLNFVGGTAKNIHYGDIHTKFATTFDVSREHVPFVNQGEALPDLASGDYCVEGDLVFADASEDMNDVGKTMEIVRLNSEQVLAGQHTILARQRGMRLVIGFGAYLFGSELMRARIKKEAQGTKVYQISAVRLGGIDVTFPREKAEQKKIADCLKSLDEVIAAQGRKVEVLKAHKRGLMQKLFPREGETRPRLRFPEFRNAAEWEATSVGDWSKSFSGGTPPTTRADYYGGDIPFIRSAEIGSERTELFLTGIGLKASSAKLVDKGDVLLALYGANSGDVALAQTSGAINQAILCIRPDGSKAFLYHYLTALQPWLVATFLQGGQGNLSGEIVKSVGIRVPSSEEQQCIADCLTSLDTRITAETARLAALKSHKWGLMQQLFPLPDAATSMTATDRDGHAMRSGRHHPLGQYNLGLQSSGQSFRPVPAWIWRGE